MGLLDKAKDLAAQHDDKLAVVVEKAGDAVDRRTSGKYSDKVNAAQDAVRTHLARDER